MIRRHVQVVVLAGAALLAGGLTMTVAGAAGSDDDPPVAELTPDLEREYDELARQAAESFVTPAFRLPADQAALWVEAWTEMASCAKERGVEAFPEAPATFGDGKTPPPVISPVLLGITEDAMIELIQACPFDVSRLDAATFAEAGRAAATELQESRPGLAPLGDPPGRSSTGG